MRTDTSDVYDLVILTGSFCPDDVYELVVVDEAIVHLGGRRGGGGKGEAGLIPFERVARG